MLTIQQLPAMCEGCVIYLLWCVQHPGSFRVPHQPSIMRPGRPFCVCGLQRQDVCGHP
jgi:hypothetical protein